jgi:hypothetical protein
VLTLLRQFINESCISTWIQTSTGWTDTQKDGRHIDVMWIHKIQTYKQTICMYSVWMMHTAAGFCVFVCFRYLFQHFFLMIIFLTVLHDNFNRITWWCSMIMIMFWQVGILMSMKKKFISHDVGLYLFTMCNKTCLGRFQDCGRGKGKNM